MAFDLVPVDFEKFKPVRRRVFFASAGSLSTVLATSATGKNLIPIFYRYTGSGAATISVIAGSSGTTLIAGQVVANAGESWGPWWDSTGAGENTNIEIVASNGVGNGSYELWYIVVPGTPGLTQ